MEAFLQKLGESKKANTLTSYRRVLTDLALFYAPRPLADLTERDLEAYFSEQAKFLSPGSLGHGISVVRSYFRFVMGMTNPMEGIRAKNFSPVEKRLLTDEELLLLLGPFSDGIRGKRDEAMLALLLETGLRVSELVGLSRCDVSESDRAVFCGSGKERRRLAVSAETMERLRGYMVLSRVINPQEEAVFLGSGGTRLTRQGFWRNLKERAERLGIEDCTPNRLRQSLAKVLLAQGHSRLQVKGMLGIRSEAGLRRYEKQIKEQKLWDC